MGGEPTDRNPRLNDTTPPCCPSASEWRGRTAVPRSWALQTWIEMAKCGIGTNTTLMGSAKPREHDRHVLGCCPAGPEHEAFKWSNGTRVRWLSQLCNEAGTYLRTETRNRLISNTSVPHAADGTETAKVTDCILTEIIQTEPETQGQAQKTPGFLGRAGSPPRVRRVIRGILRARQRAQAHRRELRPGLWGSEGVRTPGMGIPANLGL